jgi:hypothetical protein
MNFKGDIIIQTTAHALNFMGCKLSSSGILFLLHQVDHTILGAIHACIIAYAEVILPRQHE